MPAILPVSTTIVLIRLIEGFKIIDMPNILLGGGPGTATQSLTLQAYIDWHTLNLGRSAAIAYLLLILVTLVATAYVSLVRPPGDGDRMTQSGPVRRSAEPVRRRSPLDMPPVAKLGAFAPAVGWALVVLFPIYWLVVTSFKTPYQVDKGPFYIPFVDFQPTLDAWHYILVELGNDTLRPYVNTVIVGLSSAAHRARARRRSPPMRWSASRTGRGSGSSGCSSAALAFALRGDGARRAAGPIALAAGARRLRRSSPRRSAGGSGGRWATATSRSG